MVIPSCALIIWSLYLLDSVFIPNSAILFAAIMGAIPGTIIFFYIWRKDPNPIWAVIFYGSMMGSSVTLFALAGGNYFLKSDEIVEVYTYILDTGKEKSRRSHCTSIYALVVHNQIELKVDFPCSVESTIRNYRQVRLELSEGLFGFDIIMDQELIK